MLAEDGLRGTSQNILSLFVTQDQRGGGDSSSQVEGNGAELQAVGQPESGDNT